MSAFDLSVPALALANRHGLIDADGLLHCWECGAQCGWHVSLHCEQCLANALERIAHSQRYTV